MTRCEKIKLLTILAKQNASPYMVIIDSDFEHSPIAHKIKNIYNLQLSLTLQALILKMQIYESSSLKTDFIVHRKYKCN